MTTIANAGEFPVTDATHFHPSGYHPVLLSSLISLHIPGTRTKQVTILSDLSLFFRKLRPVDGANALEDGTFTTCRWRRVCPAPSESRGHKVEILSGAPANQWLSGTCFFFFFKTKSEKKASSDRFMHISPVGRTGGGATAF